MRALAARVVELLDHQGQAQLDVLGYSWGEALAQQLAYQAPERVRRLVVCGTTCGPTLVLAGADDPVVPLANAKLLARRIPDCRLHVVDRAGHLFMLEAAEAMAELVRWFLGASDDELAATAGLSLASLPPTPAPWPSRRRQVLRHRLFTRMPRS